MPPGMKGRVMFFLLRTAFWISVVLVLLPTGETKPQSEGAKVGAVDALSAASSTVADMSQFCSRNPETCLTGSHAAVAFGQRAQAGAKMVYDFLSERWETGSVPAEQKTAQGKTEKPQVGKTAKTEKPEKQAPAKSQHTLKPSDLAPAYREPRREATNPQPRDKRS
jgi:hypothetical protein